MLTCVLRRHVAPTVLAPKTCANSARVIGAILVDRRAEIKSPFNCVTNQGRVWMKCAGKQELSVGGEVLIEEEREGRKGVSRFGLAVRR